MFCTVGIGQNFSGPPNTAAPAAKASTRWNVAMPVACSALPECDVLGGV